jgi:hypothetical protein
MCVDAHACQGRWVRAVFMACGQQVNHADSSASRVSETLSREEEAHAPLSKAFISRYV